MMVTSIQGVKSQERISCSDRDVAASASLRITGARARTMGQQSQIYRKRNDRQTGLLLTMWASQRRHHTDIPQKGNDHEQSSVDRGAVGSSPTN
ncbi:hypothetical protein J2X72_004318 [Phyllobacterium sp. 1468]|uniref:hypothetical protein n=1 Tax=Phyllobacterium sp. 1468 TaxID=2817759 RepID=UPI001AE6F5DB|nr:hypothetical protein [Phyllobacterium sp. 1468]MDR6635504.1 hypothetical protein [Phyllobacterium sp. 1468]